MNAIDYYGWGNVFMILWILPYEFIVLLYALLASYLLASPELYFRPFFVYSAFALHVLLFKLFVVLTINDHLSAVLG